MRRRDALFLPFLLSSTLSFAQSARSRRIAVLSNSEENDARIQGLMEVFYSALRNFGWISHDNLELMTFWTGNNFDRAEQAAKLISAIRPDVVFCIGSLQLKSMIKADPDQRIVFVTVTDPVGDGFVRSLNQPGGNVTGFSQYDYHIGEKWFELLLEAAPSVRNILVVMASDNPSSDIHFQKIVVAAARQGIAPIPAKVRSIADVESGIASLPPAQSSGLILLPGFLPATEFNVSTLAQLVISRRLPSITSAAAWAQHGCLLSYSPDQANEYKQAAAYVDRILNGAFPGSLPVQFSQSYKLTINIGLAKSLGLELPLSLTARANEVIE